MFLSSGTVPRHAARRSGQLDHRFPGGESGHELTARTGHAMRVIAEQAGTDDAIVVAHDGGAQRGRPALLSGAAPDGMPS